MDNAFEQIMNAKAENMKGVTIGPQRCKSSQKSSAIRWRTTMSPALIRESNEAFLRDLAAAAPVVLEQWDHYLRAGGAVTLEQAFFGGVNHTLRRADRAQRPPRITLFYTGSTWSNRPYAKAEHRQN